MRRSPSDSSLDPEMVGEVLDVMQGLAAEGMTMVIVTHNMQQASRVSDYTAFLYLGELVEYQETEKLFLTPASRRTEDYITGRFG